MSEVTSPPPVLPQSGRVRRMFDGIGRAGLEILVFTFAGPFLVASLQAGLALAAAAVEWGMTGEAFPAPKPGGEPVWFGFVAIYWAVYLYLPPPFLFVGVVYAILSRLFPPWLATALVSGLIGFPAFWFLSGWGVPTNADGSYLNEANVLLATYLAAGVMGSWWLVRRRHRLPTEQAAV